MFENILLGLVNVFTPFNLLICLGGLIVGVIFGALPGFSATMGVAVFVPFSYALEPDAALLLLSGVYCGGVYGGSIPAILLGIPGTPASAPTSFEGRALTKQGKAGQSLWLCTFASAFGGFTSSLALIFTAPLLALIALKVGPPEQVMIAIFGLSVVCMLAFDSMAKGLLVGFVSLVLATIGQDPQVGYPRFTFGSINLIGGVSLVPILIGLFSLPEVIKMLEGDGEVFMEAANPGKITVAWRDIKSNVGNLIRSTLIGIGIGIVPAAGPDIAAFLAYNEAKKNSRNPGLFGRGAVDGLIAAESANNGVTGGSLIPLLSLGIPGSAPAAIFLGAMYIHGLRPGSALFNNNAEIVYTLLVGFAVINIMMYFVGILFCKTASYILKLPRSVLATSIVILATVGSFAINRNMFDVFQMYIAGICGYVMVKNGYPLSPVALALLLGGMLEQALSQTAVMYPDNILMMFNRPYTVVFFCLVLLSFCWPLISQRIQKSMDRLNKDQSAANDSTS
ncbi:C4-dicarboxylate ABC transporter permease [Betaproteobacteria bacterium]|nr:C4-dicarboxylate ABC transporter permease [Betaproteobacteria bacterium]